MKFLAMNWAAEVKLRGNKKEWKSANASGMLNSSHKIVTSEDEVDLSEEKGFHTVFVEGMDKVAKLQAIDDGELEDHNIDRDGGRGLRP